MILDHNGEAGLRVADVATEAGTSIGAIYSHFRDRDALIAAARAEHYPGLIREGLRELQKVVADGLEAEQVYEALLASIVRPHDEKYRRSRWLRIASLAASRHNEALASEAHVLQREINTVMLTLIERAKELGIVDPAIDSRALSLLIQAVPVGLVIGDIDPDCAPDDDAWVAVVGRIALALAPPSGLASTATTRTGST